MFRKILFLVVFTCSALPCFAGGKPKASPAPPPRIKEDTIVSVSATAITIKHTQVKIASKAKTASKGGDTSTTYQISGVTDILIEGKSAKVGDLKPGMAVTVAADPSSGLSGGMSAKATNGDGGLARTINAHGAPAEPAAPAKAPAKKKK